MRILTLTKKGFTKEEATNDLPFTLFKDATAAWKKAGCPLIGEDFNKFMEEQLTKSTKNAPGLGCSITIKSGKGDTRKRPYKFDNVVNEHGARKYKSALRIIDVETREVLGLVFGTKNEAKEEIRKMYTEQGYRGNLEVEYCKEIVEGERLAFNVSYAPSASSEEGSWLCFGITND